MTESRQSSAARPALTPVPSPRGRGVIARRLIQLCVLLLLGAIINVVVAWSCSLWSPIVLGLTNLLPTSGWESQWTGVGFGLNITAFDVPHRQEQTWKSGWPARSLRYSLT